MFKTEKVNNIVVKPLPVQKPGTDFKGFDLFPNPYANIMIVGPKGEGKTSVLFKILMECCDKHTIVIIFCSTLHSDTSWDFILRQLDERKIKHVAETDIVDDESNKNHLHDLMTYLKQAGRDPKHKGKAPRFVFVFDDCSDDTRAKTVDKLLKTNRHFQSKVIISTQSLKDIDNKARAQINTWLLFPRLDMRLIEEVRTASGLPESTPLWRLYRQATSQPFNFLYVNRDKPEFRHNFDLKLFSH